MANTDSQRTEKRRNGQVKKGKEKRRLKVLTIIPGTDNVSGHLMEIDTRTAETELNGAGKVSAE